MNSIVSIEKSKKKVVCAGCSKHLMNILVVVENEATNVIQATCPFCGAGSEILTIRGQMYTGPVAPEESSFPTNIKDILFLENKSVFQIEKATN